MGSFITSVWCGAIRFIQTELVRADKALCRVFKWDKVPAQDAYKRYFKKFTQKINREVCSYFFSWMFKQLKCNCFTLDIDSSVFTRYGEQEGAVVGYNPTKKSRSSQHPIFAFINDFKMVANVQLREGNVAAATGFSDFLEET